MAKPLLRACVLLGALVALSTEILGEFHLLTRPVLLVWWVVVCLGVAILLRRFPARLGPASIGYIEAGLLLAVACVAALVGATAVLSPPNSADALAYHLPRVIYWKQAGSVAFFPTPYFNQISLQPLAEYFMLHLYLLSGGDHWTNLVQFFGFLGSTVGVTAIAAELGAGRRGQVLAAVFCATIPNGIEQASGAKNDYLLSLWLVAMVYFVLRWSREWRTLDLITAAVTFALALFTKGTAYVFAPVLLLGALGPSLWREPKRTLRAAAVFGICALTINGALYWRNYWFSGSPLGYHSAQGDGRFRWTNDRFGPRTTVSNATRELSDHLAGRSDGWNQGVYRAVLRVHSWMGADPNDPATTWLWTTYQPPKNANHEANAPNRWHLLLIILSSAPLIWLALRRQRWDALWLYLVTIAAFVLFCTIFRWQPFLGRLHLPLFVINAAVLGLFAEELMPGWVQVLLCLFLLNGARPFVFENWTRPLKGPNSVLHLPREKAYFLDMGQWNVGSEYFDAAAATLASGCTQVGIDASEFQLEYPFEALVLARNPAVRFQHTGVVNASARYRDPQTPEPCAVLCLNCDGKPARLKPYSGFAKQQVFGQFVVAVH